MTDEAIIKRRIKSFVLRTGRMTPGQQQAYESAWPKFGLQVDDGRLAFDEVFGRTAETILEIGFGMGDSLCQMARENPDKNYIGVEVHTPGVGRLLHLTTEAGIENVRVFEDDAVKVIHQCIADESLSGVQIFFPDPWHKKKHHKRRIVQDEFIATLLTKIKPGGFVHLATDWEHYAMHMLSVLARNSQLQNSQSTGGFTPRPDSRPLTKFERRGKKLGHGVWDLYFFKNH